MSILAAGGVEALFHPCPKDAPKPGSSCTLSLGFDKPPDTCEYNEHCHLLEDVERLAPDTKVHSHML